MSDAPLLTDRTALVHNRARASEFFLHEIARDEVEDRVALVNRTFTAPAVVTPFAPVWRGFADTVVTDDDILALNEGAHDLVVHALGLHWANDPVGQLIQCRRALSPDGLFIGVTLGGQTLHELRAALAEAEVQVTGGLSPRVLPMADIRDLGGLLQRAGFALPVADGAPLTASYDTPLHLMKELRAMGEGNAMVARLKSLTARAVITEAAARYPKDPDGRCPATFDMIVLTGWAPDANQPQPLRPGSATTRLADALGTTETPLDD